MRRARPHIRLLHKVNVKTTTVSSQARRRATDRHARHTLARRTRLSGSPLGSRTLGTRRCHQSARSDDSALFCGGEWTPCRRRHRRPPPTAACGASALSRDRGARRRRGRRRLRRRVDPPGAPHDPSPSARGVRSSPRHECCVSQWSIAAWVSDGAWRNGPKYVAEHTHHIDSREDDDRARRCHAFVIHSTRDARAAERVHAAAARRAATRASHRAGGGCLPRRAATTHSLATSLAT